MALMSRQEAEREGKRRFDAGTSRYSSFMASWAGLHDKGKFGREKYRNTFGKGRRSR